MVKDKPEVVDFWDNEYTVDDIDSFIRFVGENVDDWSVEGTNSLARDNPEKFAAWKVARRLGLVK